MRFWRSGRLCGVPWTRGRDCVLTLLCKRDAICQVASALTACPATSPWSRNTLLLGTSECIPHLHCHGRTAYLT